MFIESICKICGRHIMKQLDAPKPVWFHTPMFDEPQPTDHKPDPNKVIDKNE